MRGVTVSLLYLLYRCCIAAVSLLYRCCICCICCIALHHASVAVSTVLIHSCCIAAVSRYTVSAVSPGLWARRYVALACCVSRSTLSSEA